jgi:thiamine-phosphate pyrophosphorylase
MSETERPQIYLFTPPELSLAGFPDLLARVLDEVPVACLRLQLATSDVDTVSRSADALREVAYARDVPLVIADHIQLVERLGLDGVHLSDGSKSVRATRKALGADAIIGAFCAQSRHDGMNAAEAGADYVAFGPAGITPLGDGSRAEAELFAWWSDMIEIPVVAEGALDAELARALAPVADFIGVGEEIWRDEDPAAMLRRFAAALG